MSDKDILIITPTFSGGGAEHIAVNIANYYSTTEKNVVILCFSDYGPYRDLISEKVELVNLKTEGWLSIINKLRIFLKNNDNFRVISTVRSSNIIYGLASIFLKKRKKSNAIYLEVNTFDSLRKKPILKRFIWKFSLFISYLNAKKIVCSSMDVENDLLSTIPLSKEKTVSLGNPVLPDNFNIIRKEAPSFDHEWFKENDLKIYLNVGRLHYQKNQEFLIRGFKEHIRAYPNSRLMIIGEGEDIDKLKILRSNLELDGYVDFISFIDNLFPIMKQVDIFVMTSRWEGFGNVFIMAMACGLPILSSDCPGGPKEIIVSNKLGNLYTNNSLESFKEMAGKIYDHKNDFKSLKMKLTHAKKYSIQNIAKQYLNILK